MRRYVVTQRAGVSAAQRELLDELDILLKKLANPSLRNKYRTKKHILKALTKSQFKTPYKQKWWKALKETEVRKLMNSAEFKCPECGQSSSRPPTLQHIWHPVPYRVLCTQRINDETFKEQIPSYIKLQQAVKGGLCKKEFERWWGRVARYRNAPSYTEKALIEYGVCKARSNFALGYFSDDEILVEHIGEIKRHVEMHREDYKYVCAGCAYAEDKSIIDAGLLIPDVPYFLLHDGCPRRDVLAQHLIEAFVATL